MDNDLREVFDLVAAIVALVSAGGLLLLLPLYLSQRRDIARLREWMDREPEHASADLRTSEHLLDRAETELEELVPSEEVAIADTAVAPPREGIGVAGRVTSERPALERVTMERAALQPHPRWRRFAAGLSQPRWLAAIGVGVIVLGVLAVFGSDRLLEQFNGDEREPKSGAVVPEDVTVTVLNGTSVPGLAAKVGDDIEANGFVLAGLDTREEPLDRTVVFFAPDQEKEAKKVARSLGGYQVKPIDADTRRAAADADVVVVAGEDRAGL